MGNHTRDSTSTLRGERARVERRVAKRMAAHERAENELRLLLKLTQEIAAAQDFESALATSLRNICEATGWDYGEAWLPDAEAGLLTTTVHWLRTGLDEQRFETLRKGVSFAPHVGLPGRVWASQRPEWHRDIAASGAGNSRASMLLKVGVKATFGVSVLAGHEVVAVLLLATLAERDQDRYQIELVTAVAAQLGLLFRQKQAQEDSFRSAALTQAMLDNSSRVIYLKDRAGRYVRVNHQFQNLFRVALEDITGKTDHDIFPAEFADVFRANDLAVLAGGTALEFEESAPQADGIHVYQSNKFPMFDKSGAAYGVCGFSTDITALKHQEHELRAKAQHSEDFAQSIVDTAQVILLLLNPEGQVAFCNAYFSQLTGFSREEAQGQDWFSAFLPERDQERIRQVFFQALAGQPVEGNINPIRGKDGRGHEIQWNANLLKEEDGSVIGLLCAGLDITEQRRAEAMQRAFVQTTQDALVVIHREGQVQLFNPAAERMFGYRSAEIVGQSVNCIMPEPHSLLHDSYIDRYETTGESRAVGRVRTLMARRKSGDCFPVEIAVTKVGTADGLRYVAFIRDISERVELERRLIERERLSAVGLTAAKFAHEIGNPLNGMYMTAQLIESRLARAACDDPEIAAKFHSITAQIRRLNDLLADFRSFYRDEPYHFKAVSLAAVVASTLKTEQAAHEARGIRVELAVPEDLPPLVADGARLQQVFTNLFKNAVEAMPHGGTMTIRAARDESRAVIEVADTGDGVPDGIDIWQPFKTSKPAGSGLGLMIVRQIVAEHHGTITYTSECGKGTTFRVCLPLNREVSAA